MIKNTRKKLKHYSLASATLASVTRYEGFLVLAILLLYLLFKERENIVQYLVIPAIVIVPWILFTHFYFGSIIPHAITAKLALYSHIDSTSVWGHLKYLLALNTPFGWFLLVGAVWGAVWLNKNQNSVWKEIIWFVSMIIFYTLSKTHLFFWYVAPLYTMFWLFFGAGVVNIFEQINIFKENKKLQTTSSVLAIIVLAIYLYPVMKSYKFEQSVLNEVHHKVGDYLYSHTDKNDLIAAEDIGYIGYYSKRKILDRDGLISPDAVPYNRNGKYYELIQNLKPNWVVLYTDSRISTFYTDKRFTNEYSLKKSFKSSSGIEYLMVVDG